MLLEGNYLFDILDTEENFNKYKVIILPDVIKANELLKGKLQDYINQGGKILATGESCLDKKEREFVLDFGIKYEGENPYKPDYFVPQFSYHGLGTTSFVMYSDGVKISLNGGEIIGEREDSYFNRDILHFCSHNQTPNEPGKRSPGMVKSKSGIYISWKVFDDYATRGSLILKDTVKYALDMLLGDSKTLLTNLKAQGIVTLQHQKNENRYINHLLYATPVKRGENVEIIEDIVPVYDIDVELKLSEKVKRVYLAPQMKDISFEQENDKVEYKVDKVDCHQMVVIEY
jgi:hypothetical protein